MMADNKQASETTIGQTETFFSRNVRLITFLICIAIFLGVFGPLSVFHIKRYIDEQTDTRVQMQIEDVRAIVKKLPRVKPSDFDGFIGECGENQIDGMKYRIYQIEIGEQYLLMVSFNSSINELFYLELTNFETNHSLDLLKEADLLDVFLQVDNN